MRISTLDGIFSVQYVTLTAGTLLATFLLALGATEFQIGLVASFPLLGGLLQPLGAELIRRQGGWRKPSCVAAAVLDDALWLVSILAVLLLPPAHAVLVVIGVVAVQQMANAVTSVAWTSWMSDLIPTSLRGRYFGHRNFTCNALGALTAIGVGFVIRSHTTPSLDLFLVIIGVGMVVRAASIFFLTRQPEPCPASCSDGGFTTQMAEPLRNPGFRRYVAYAVAWGFAVNLAAPFFTVYMVREQGISMGTVLFFSGLSTISNLLGQRFWGPLCDRFGDHQVLRSTGLGVVLQPFWWIFTSDSGAGFLLMGLLSITGGFAWSGSLLATGNLMVRLAPQTGKTAFFGVQAALGGLFGALGPFVGGALATWLMTASPGAPLPFEGLKNLFILSFVLRLGAWGLLHRVPEPVARPRLRTVYLLRDVVRTFNPAQGFSPLLHTFVPATVRPDEPVRTASETRSKALRASRFPFRKGKPVTPTTALPETV